jgi:hypothetical protein
MILERATKKQDGIGASQGAKFAIDFTIFILICKIPSRE